MTQISKPNTFSPNTTISSSEVNSNFDTLYNDYNGNVNADNLASNAVTTAKINDLAVTTGKLADGAVTAAKMDATLASGWTTHSTSISSVTANGNRSYTMVTGTDISSLISPGMRMRTTRTVAAPTQCADLESSSSQYFSKSSPNKLSFTDDYTTMAWVKLESYAGGGIIARRNADIAGWSLGVGTDGRVEQISLRIASNNSSTKSYASLPLGRWVHVAATTDLSGTSTIIYINGVVAPSLTTVVGTITALVQGTTALVVGAYTSAGATTFDGKIAQAAVFNAVLSASTIRSYMSQGLTGSETNLASAFSLNNSLTDLNTTTPNDLTAQGSALATNADSPFGGQADGTISSTLDYAIISSVSTTTINVQVPEGCTIPTSGGVTSLAYSNVRAPYMFPAQRNKWIIATIILFNFSTGASANTWVAGTAAATNILSLTVPIGEWSIRYVTNQYTDNGGSVVQRHHASISTSSSAETIFESSSVLQAQSYDGNSYLQSWLTNQANISVSAQTAYYMIVKSLSANAHAINGQGPTVIEAANAYV